MKKILNNQKGTTIVLVAVIMAAVMGAAALVTDIGLAYFQKQKLANAVDAAALAAAQKLNDGQATALETAQRYVNYNGYDNNSIQVSFPDTDSVEVRGENTVKFIFAKAMGFDSTQVNVKARAIIAPVTGIRGVRPLAVEKFPFQYGQQYVLKEGAGDSYNGNFGPVALGGTGADNYRNNLKYGYSGMLRAGDWIKTETGNMPTPTEEGIDYLMDHCDHSPKCTISQYEPSCSRMIVIPVVNTMEVNGRGEIQVVGFAQFLLAGIGRDGGHSIVTGWFIKNTAAGEIDPNATDFGLYSIKLTQ